MRKVNVSELRQHLPDYLEAVREGEPIQITRRGKVVARLVPEEDRAEEARRKLAEIRKTSWLGDVESPLDVEWDAGHGRL